MGVEDRVRILRKLGIEPANEEGYQILIASLGTLLKYADGITSLMRWRAPVLPSLRLLSPGELRMLEFDAEHPMMTIGEGQVRVQKLLPQDVRKRFAAYYTVDRASRFMASIVREFLRARDGDFVLADPFLGSGITLTKAISAVGPNRINMVWGIEPLPLPALVAYAALLDAMRGRRDLVNVVVGDAFRELPGRIEQSLPHANGAFPRANVILTNPPFTRWRNLGRDYRRYLLSVIDGLGYGKYVTREDASLQTLSMFLCDYALSENGLLISVLPASTFYASYGVGYKKLLRERYDVYALIENDAGASFSEDSGFKELILVAVKRRGSSLAMFIRLNEDVEGIARDVMNRAGNHPMVNLRELPKFLDRNWLVLFEEYGIRDVIINVIKQGLSNSTLTYWVDEPGARLVRGIEMYGPDFFFVPNRHWGIEEGGSYVLLRGPGGELEIPREFLIKALRKPSLYSRKIRADVNTYMVSIPPLNIEELPHGLREYIRWGVDSGVAKPAMNAHGRFWYSHVYRQVMTKRPFGHVFIPDKVDLLFRDRGVFANYSEEEVAASKNFYIVRGVGDELSKLLIGWFNSTIFISMLVLLGRKISDTWTRLLERDYLEIPMISINVGGEAAQEVVGIVDELLDRQLPPMWRQIGEGYRYELDLAVARLIGLKDPEVVIEELYEALNRHYASLHDN